MTSKIKILSWNVEHFKKNKTQEVAQIIKKYNPDVFGIYEVEANSVYTFIKQYFPDYSVFITEGQQRQEILVACRNSHEFKGIKFQQKHEFKSGNPHLRPGAFLTFEYQNQEQYNFLFLHTDSGTSAVDFGNRTEMFEHAYNLKRKLDESSNSSTNFMILGDLNTMGLKYPKQIKSDIIATTSEELEYLKYYSQKGNGRSGYKKRNPNLRILSKPHGTYYSKTYGISDLDHIIASDHMVFTAQTNYHEDTTHDIFLDGWREYLNNSQKMDEFVEEISDHCLLFCELHV